MQTYKSCDRPITEKAQLLYLFTLPSYPRTSLYRRAYPHDCQVNICTSCRTYRYYLNRNRYLTIIIPALHGTLLVRHDSPHYISKRIHTLTNILFQPYTPPSAMLRTTPGTVQREKRAIARERGKSYTNRDNTFVLVQSQCGTQYSHPDTIVLRGYKTAFPSLYLPV